jgi:hypothetical protein
MSLTFSSIDLSAIKFVRLVLVARRLNPADAGQPEHSIASK